MRAPRLVNGSQLDCNRSARVIQPTGPYLPIAISMTDRASDQMSDSTEYCPVTSSQINYCEHTHSVTCSTRRVQRRYSQLTFSCTWWPAPMHPLLKIIIACLNTMLVEAKTTRNRGMFPSSSDALLPPICLLRRVN